MKNKHFWSVLACAMILVGFGAGLIGCILIGFDFNKLNMSGDPVQNSHEITEEFDSINIDTSVSDISFKVSEDDKVRVVCDEREKEYHEVTVENKTLKIKKVTDRKWYEWISFFNFSGHNSVVIYLPKANAKNSSWKQDGTPDFVVKDLTIDTSTGDIELSNLLIEGALNVNSSTGELNCSRVQAGSILVDHSTGKVTMDKVLADNLKIETSTGDVRFTNGDASNVDIDTSTGDVYCTFLSDKILTTDTSTGDIKTPKTSSGTGGTCNIDTSTGDITVEYITK